VIIDNQDSHRLRLLTERSNTQGAGAAQSLLLNALQRFSAIDREFFV
jgi:hypothetical protein